MKNALNTNKNKKLLIIMLLILIVLIGGTYAILRLTFNGTKTNRIKVGKLSLELEGQNEVSLLDVYPMTDEEGKETTSYNFTLTNNGDVTGEYTVTLTDLDIGTNTRMLDSYIKYRITSSDDRKLDTTMNLAESNRILDSGTIEPNEIKNYTLQLWMDYDAPNEAQGTVFKSSVTIEGRQKAE